MERYSVLMSLYIKEKPDYLRQSISSMINQTTIPDEIVIVKDGPLTNELEEVLDDFIVKFPELFNIVVSKKNIGLGLALNLGLKYCKNELVARMDTDDISLPDRCEKQIKAFQQDKELSIVSGNISEFIGDESNIVGRRIVPVNDKDIKEYLKKRCPLNHVAVMFKKSSVITAGGYKHLYWNEDYYLWIRMAQSGALFANLNDTLVLVRVGADMYRRRGGKKYFESEIKLQKYMLDKKIINRKIYVINVFKRFIVQRMLPNSLRGWVFKTFARN